jgi:hypothetical protein
VVCAECRTANRDENGKFCKGCGRRLIAHVKASALAVGGVDDVTDPADTLPGAEEEWPATQRMAYHPDIAPGELFDRAIPATAISGAAEAVTRARRPLPAPIAAPPSSSQSARSARGASGRRSSYSRNAADKRPSIASRLGTWGLVIAVVAVVAVGWGYVYNSRNTAVPLVAKELPAPVPADPAEPPSPVPLVEPAPVAIAPAAPLDAHPVVSAKPVTSIAKPRKAAVPAPVSSIPAATIAPEPAPPPAPEPAAPASPQSLCAGMNFIARAQCLAAQCAKADYKAHAQCEAVRRQQQIEEEKRNPTLVN